MFIHFQIFIFISSIGQFIAQPLDKDLSSSNNDNQDGIVIAEMKFQQVCLICQVKQQQYDDGNVGDGMQIDALLEYDKTMFRDVYEKFEFDEANNQLRELKLKGNAFEMEKDANKQNALKKWHRLPIIRLRIHKIEESILDGDTFGDNIRTFQRIDNIRNSATEISKVLDEVYNYYKQMDDELTESYSILADIEVKLNAKREKEGKVRRSKCFLFFCY